MASLTLAVSNVDELLTRANPDADAAHDPTVLPEFPLDRTHPILYLPPLLSALPESFPSTLDSDNPTLTTQSRLPDIDPASLSFHRALHRFRPLDGNYASRPYDEAFNWNELELPTEEERDWYCVAFRSYRKEGSDSTSLYEADKAAHEEAVQHGGLIMYWFGIPHPDTGLNLATCIWRSRQHAILANCRPNHIRAAVLTKSSYEKYELDRWVIRKFKGETGIQVEPYTEGPVGW